MRKNINQPYIIRSLMALALLLMPLEIWAQKTVSLRWGSPNNAANFVEVTEWTMNWSGKYGDYPTLNNPNQVTVTYSSSATNVATIDANGLIVHGDSFQENGFPVEEDFFTFNPYGPESDAVRDAVASA